MEKQKLPRKNYLSRLISSLRSLWEAREKLAFRHIRRNYLQYFFAFPLAMIFINIQDFIFNDGIGVFGLAHTTMTFIAFALGGVITFAFTNKKNISLISKISAVITLIGFIPWLLFPRGYLSLVFDMIFIAGVGGCVSSSSFSFVFMLNNAERFYGSTLILFVIDLVELSNGFFSVNPVFHKLFTFFIIIALGVSIFLSKSEDFLGVCNNTKKKFNPSILLVLYIFLSYFAIRITGFYALAFQHPSNALLWGIIAFVLALGLIILQVLFRKSIWTLCNVFFISSILSHLMYYLKFPEGAYMFSELKEVGLLITFYLIGCITNKFCDFRLHKHLILISMTVIGILYVGIDVLHNSMPTQTLAVITASALFIIFLLLSPSFSQHLFFADWSKEFRQINMISQAGDSLQTNKPEQYLLSLDDTSLSPREKQIVLLLLRGMTLRQVAPELGLTASTVSTYSKTIYKKLGINSRAELFMLFSSISVKEKTDITHHK